MLRLPLSQINRCQYTFPSPLWGGVRGGAGKVISRASSADRFATTPLPTLPHQACTRARASAARAGRGNRNCRGYRRVITPLLGAVLLCAPARAEVQKLLHPC